MTNMLKPKMGEFDCGMSGKACSEKSVACVEISRFQRLVDINHGKGSTCAKALCGGRMFDSWEKNISVLELREK